MDQLILTRMMVTEKVLDEVAQERARQVDKWGDQSHTNGIWYPILGEEYGEVGEEINNLHFGSGEIDDIDRHTGMLRTELIQVAAVAVAWVENIDAGS